MFGDEKVNSYIRSLKANGTPHKTMTGGEANERYSAQLKLPEDYVCVMDEEGGILRANAAVSALQVNIIIHHNTHKIILIWQKKSSFFFFLYSLCLFKMVVSYWTSTRSLMSFLAL